MKQDIINYISKKWEEKEEVIELINEWDAKCKSLLDDRLIRSVLYISLDTVESVKESIELARLDYRDVYWQAEYDCTDIRKRDFSKEFNKNAS